MFVLGGAIALYLSLTQGASLAMTAAGSVVGLGNIAGGLYMIRREPASRVEIDAAARAIRITRWGIGGSRTLTVPLLEFTAADVESTEHTDGGLVYRPRLRFTASREVPVSLFWHQTAGPSRSAAEHIRTIHPGRRECDMTDGIRDVRRVIFASSLGTVFEWYDFYLYGSLAAIISRQFFSAVNPTAAFIFALLAFAAGFAVRPFGALVFGRLGDLVGRKYTFLLTIIIMGLSTFIVGVLPSYATHRHPRAGLADRAATAAGARARRRVRRRGDVRGRARAGGEARRVHVVDPDHGHAGTVPLAAW